MDLASEPGVEHNDLVDLLYRVGYMTPEPTENVLALFVRTLQDPRPTIRRAALNGVMIRRWPQLWELVENLDATDPDEEVRATARSVLDLGPAT